MTPEVFPIGHYLGERHPEGLHYVRVGLEHQTMTTDEFGVWVLSHQESPQWTVDKVVTLAGRADIPNAAAAAERLLSVGLLANVTNEESFTRSYRLDPLLVGFGNTEEDPDTYTVGLPGHAPVRLSPGPYELWQWSALAPTLWHTAEVRAKVSEPPSQPATLLSELLADVRPLLANSCGYLDPTQ